MINEIEERIGKLLCQRVNTAPPPTLREYIDGQMLVLCMKDNSIITINENDNMDIVTRKSLKDFENLFGLDSLEDFDRMSELDPIFRLIKMWLDNVDEVYVACL